MYINHVVAHVDELSCTCRTRAAIWGGGGGGGGGEGGGGLDACSL